MRLGQETGRVVVLTPPSWAALGGEEGCNWGRRMGGDEVKMLLWQSLGFSSETKKDRGKNRTNPELLHLNVIKLDRFRALGWDVLRSSLD